MHASTISSSSVGIDKATGISKPAFYRNLPYPDIYEHEVANKEGVTASNGAFVVTTGKFTGRSPKDKFFVQQAPSDKNLDWGKVNMPVSLQVYKDVYQRSVDHYNKNVSKAYVFDGFCGTNPKSRKAVRIITELAWQHHFVTNMFIRPTSPEEIKDFKPDFTIINACKVTNPDWKEKKLNSDVAAIFNVEDRMAVITGTWYGGEMKKGVFSMMNYWLPLEGIMAMHCSANKASHQSLIGKGGDTALFFGLSGTGKTTLSADPNRFLIGDDEHGWDDDGIFNFEGGCYAKTIKLRRENEPEIFDAIKRDALLENVKILENGDVDYDDKTITENGRVSYPIYHIANYEPTGMGGHPANVIFLTCDAFGVLPPVSRLSEGQAMYHFLSGYTAKVAGTERGITEPVPNFSACFGAAFMTLHPTKYADLLKQKLQKHNTKCYLVNTGWTGGAYGVGERMSIKATRACIDAILDGSIDSAPTVSDPVFGFDIPTKLKDVPASVLDPKQSWKDKDAYEAARSKLAGMFKKNYEQFRKPGMTDYASFGPK
ncbi:phosphoenolpyruvate carboxykinase [Tribonema minus]|uniref:phosphoenolpyruvate carboxykinase (ATP) n=1 Tax=Tribonema minus TaxID=303371 RepID=A0A835YNF1_9STRA|nr:phosphoenolpyruvate carboxykinase [Tribonema minus]